jgi:hypothetical protein
VVTAGFVIGVVEGAIFVIERSVRDRGDRYRTALAVAGTIPAAWLLATLAWRTLLHAAERGLAAVRAPRGAAPFACTTAALWLVLRHLDDGERIARWPLAALYGPAVAILSGFLLPGAWRAAERALRGRRRHAAAFVVALIAGGLYALDRWRYLAPYPAARVLLCAAALALATAACSAFGGAARARFAWRALLILPAAAGTLAFAVLVFPRPHLAQRVAENASVAGKVIEGLSAVGVWPGGRRELDDGHFARIAAAFSAGRSPALELDATPAPAILLVTLEATRSDHLGFVGYARATSPRLDAFARTARSTADAWTTANASHQALVALIGGRYRGVAARAGGEIAGIFASWRALEVETAAVFPRSGMLDHEDLFGDFDCVESYVGPGEAALTAIDRILAPPRTRPLFLWVHLVDPHAPYEPAPSDRIFGQDEIALYDGEIRAMDRAFGLLIDRFDRAFAGRRTVVAVTSDHGEAFGEHGLYFHKTGLHEEQIRVPLIVRSTGLPAGELPAPASHVDLLPTVCALAFWPLPAGLDGRDLTDPACASQHAPPVFCRHEGRAVAVRLGSRKLISTTRLATAEVYDLALDPRERNPVVSSGQGEEIEDTLLAFDLRPGGLLARLFGETALRDAAHRGRSSADSALAHFSRAVLTHR